MLLICKEKKKKKKKKTIYVWMDATLHLSFIVKMVCGEEIWCESKS